jgi:hypothetical protein
MRTNPALTIAVIALLGGAVQGSAALPEDGISACRELRSELVYIARAGAPFRYRLFQEEIDRAREAWVKAQAAYDKSPRNIDLQIAAIEAHAEFENWTIRSFETTLAPMTIERVFRGNPAAESFVVLGNDMKLDAGRSYAFYGENRFANFGLNFHQGWAQDVNAAPAAIRVLEASATNGGGTIFGQLQTEHADRKRTTTPMGGTRIRLTIGGYVEEVVTDENGVFVVSNVPAGSVTLTPLISDEFAIIDRGAQAPSVVAGRCSLTDLVAALNGRIRGRVFDRNGKPRSDLQIELLPTDYMGLGPPGDARYKTSTNERGEFEFHAIPPGSYFVGHQIHRSDAIPSGGYPPSTYFPGAPNRIGAKPIVVGNATQHDGFDFTVP